MKPRNREINIFNMSLLDILCGALGAFCFMMLSLLPYYRPPDQNFNVSEQQKKLLDEVQKIKDLAEKLKDADNVEDLRKLVEELKKQIAQLEEEIKKLQGQVNSLLAENGELKRRVAKLDEENKRLLARNDVLEKENQRLRAENEQLRQDKQKLLARNEQLEKENQRLQQEKQRLEQQKQELEGRLQQRMPWSVTVTASDPRLPLDCSLHEQVVLASGDNSRQPDFDPSLMMQPSMWTGDYRMGGTGTVTRVNANRYASSETKFYIRANGPHSTSLAPGGRATLLVLNTDLSGAKLNAPRVPPVTLGADRDWVYVGKFRIETPETITFTEATQAERDAEWERLTKTAPPTDPQLTDAVMGPGFERRKREYEAAAGPNPPPPVREALLEAWLAQAQNLKERDYVMSLLKRNTGPPGGGSMDSMRRRATYTRALQQAQSQDEKTSILRRWMNEADSDMERDYVRTLIRQGPGVGPDGRRTGPSNFMRGMEEFQRPGPASPAPVPQAPPAPKP